MNERNPQRPLRIINSVAPIRVCDNGGWTDTWFAEYGRVFNIGVYPYAEVQIEVYPCDDRERVLIYAENFGERYARDPSKTGWDRHPLLEAAIERAEARGVRVRILTNSLRSNNHVPAHSFYRNHVQRLHPRII